MMTTNTAVRNEEQQPQDEQENAQEVHGEYENESESESEGESENEQRSRFKPGQMLTFIRVRFPGNSKSFAFLLGDRTFQYGHQVVAMSDRGMAVGYINSFPYQRPYDPQMGHIRSIVRFAEKEDIELQKKSSAQERSAEWVCSQLIEKFQLDMVLTHVEFTQFGKKAVIYFTAPARVDFRELVKELVRELKIRIELRQVSVRDRSAAIGGIGACGRETCCSSFLKNYGNVSIKMAKNQNLALIPTKINGVCGQVKCCIKYEDKVYTHKRSFLPEEQSIIRAKNGDIGRVLRIHILAEQFDLLTAQGKKRRYSSDQFTDESVLTPEEARAFPTQFEHVADETEHLVGEGMKMSDVVHDQRLLEREQKQEPQQSQEAKQENENENEVLESDKAIGPQDRNTASSEEGPQQEQQQRPQHHNHNHNPNNQHRRGGRRHHNNRRNNGGGQNGGGQGRPPQS
jgi:cell fate regulator YaaT (PSP1 superfamily)